MSFTVGGVNFKEWSVFSGSAQFDYPLIGELVKT